jgi:hypothetical protein
MATIQQTPQMPAMPEPVQLTRIYPCDDNGYPAAEANTGIEADVSTYQGKYATTPLDFDRLDTHIAVLNEASKSFDYVPRSAQELTPQQQNERADRLRAAAYRNESDPLGMKFLRGEVTKEEWKAKIAEIRERYPKIEN